MGRLRAYFDQLAHPMQDVHSGTITRAYCRAIYEESVSRCFILPPLAGEIRRSRKGGGERSELISRILCISYDTESQSRNADFILIARRAIPQPSARRAVKLTNPPALRPVHPKNPFPQPFSTILLHNLPPTGGHNPRDAAPSTLTPKACPQKPI